MRRLVLLTGLAMQAITACTPRQSDEAAELTTTQPDVGIDEPASRAGMIEIPASSFSRGCDDAVESYCENDPDADILLDGPMRSLWISAFWIDQYEVTIEDYTACGDAGECTAPNGALWTGVDPPAMPNLPVSGVTWGQANTYCAWAGKRLPTEAEWEKAARGDQDTRRYPWGEDAPVCGQQAHLSFPVDACESVDHVVPVDAFPGDRSPYGVIGMLGNVQEWVADWAGRSYYATCPDVDPPGPEAPETTSGRPYRILRGSYFGASAVRASVTKRRWLEPDDSVGGRTGFRCARTDAPE